MRACIYRDETREETRGGPARTGKGLAPPQRSQTETVPEKTETGKKEKNRGKGEERRYRRYPWVVRAKAGEEF